MQVAEKHQPDRIRPERWLRALAGPAVLLAITVGFYWKLVLTDQYTWLDGPDTANQVLPWFQFQAGEWHRGRFPLWDPFHATGQPLLGQGQPGAAYPLDWIVFSLPLRQGWLRQSVLHWYFVLIHFLAALFCYWLCRDLKRSRLAAIVAGTAFGLGGYVAVTAWPQMLNGAIWAPLVCLFLLRAIRGIRPVSSAALGGLFLGVSWLSGHHQVPMFFALTAAAAWIYAAARRGRSGWRLLPPAALFGVFSLLTGALQLLPAFEYGKLARRWLGLAHPIAWNQAVPYHIHTQYSLDPTSLIGLLLPGISRQASAFVGVVALALALLALLAGARRPAVRLFAIVTVWGLLLALGGYSVVHGILYALVPFLDKARTPQAAILVFSFGIAVLTSYGIDTLRSRRSSAWLRRLSTLLAAAASAICLLLTALWVFRDHATDEGLALSALVSLLAAGVLWARSARHIRAGAAASCCLLLMALELAYVHTGWLGRSDQDRNHNLRKLAQFADIARFFESEPWPVRVDLEEREVPFNFGDWHGIDVLMGYSASFLENFLALGLEGENARKLLGVTHEVRKEPARPTQLLVYRGAGGLNVYQNPDAFPRVWAVHEVVALKPGAAIADYISGRGVDLRRRAFLVRGPVTALETCGGPEAVRLLRREPAHVRIDAEMRCTGLVVLSDGFFPGWRASLDGQPATIYPAYGGLRGVVVPVGRHRIEMRYRPLSVTLGAIMTALGILGACALALWERRRGRMIRWRSC